ncbi:sulfurtransferase [Aurantibacter sp.]|uniref:sulfurtransferase n=1 Tax=Aurantibacter sp. TaxID=2807103 RepID=UPI0035C78E26
MSNLVSVEWLNSHLNDENLIILDATIPKVTSKAEITKLEVIPNAIFFDIINKFSDVLAPFPNTIPSQVQFQESAQELGVNNNSKIVVYDALGIYSSPRVFWLFKTFGFENVFVLNGGLPEWKKQGYKTVLEYAKTSSKGDFTAKYQYYKNVLIDSICEILENNSFSIIDARSSARFNCEIPEPRKKLRSGTIPNSVNLPYQMVLDNGLLKPKKELKSIFSKLINNQNLVFSCGSGVTASILYLAALEADYTNTSIYDGSWTEYGTLIK